jgi:hypothetical protein
MNRSLPSFFLSPARALFPLALIGASLIGCASGTAVTRSADKADLNLEEAERIVETYHRRHEIREASANPLKEPRSLDDVMAVLRSDEILLFPGAVKFASAEGSPRGKALAAQLLVAWGDAQLLLAELLARATLDLEQTRAKLDKESAEGKLSEADKPRLERARQTLTDIEGVERALRRVGQRHINDGATQAQALIAAAPNDYEGYRVAADYYHVTEDWQRFDQMVKEIERRHPQSVGLLFLRAEAARDRDKDPGTAAKLFKEALDRDPKFARAQAALLLLAPDLSSAHAELQSLSKINPDHQLVRWVGPTLERDFRAWRAVVYRRLALTTDRATPAQ